MIKEIKTWDEISKIIVSTEGPLKFLLKEMVKLLQNNKSTNKISDSQNMFNEKIKKE